MQAHRRPTSADVFNSNKDSLQSLLEDIDSGRLQLPNFQRNWRWPDDHIVSLLESLAEGHPIGAPMLMQTGGNVEFEHRPFDGAEHASAEPTHLALDGQQRLTSAYQACYSERPVRIRSDKKTKYRLYFFDMAKATSADYGIEDAIISLPTDINGNFIGTSGIDLTDPEEQYSGCFFPANKIFASDEWEEAYDEYWDSRRENNQRQAAVTLFRDFRKQVIDQFRGCMIPVITLTRNITTQGICKVYEKLNSKGVSLDAFDLLIAQYAAQKFNLRSDWFGENAETPIEGNGIRAELVNESRGLLTSLTPKQFLQAVSMVNDLHKEKKLLGTSKSSILELSLSDYLRHRDSTIAGFIAAAKEMVHEGIYSDKNMPSMGVVTAFSVIMSFLGPKTRDNEIRRKLRRWFWCVFYNPYYGNGTDKTLSIDVPEVIGWLQGGQEPRSVEKCYIYQDSIGSARKKGKSAFATALTTRIMKENPVDFATGNKLTGHLIGDGKFDMHHVFPKKWCIDNAIDENLFESIINKTPLSFMTNRHIGGAAPSEYLRKIETAFNLSSYELDSFIRSHQINPIHLRNDDFDAFYRERLQALTQFVESDIGRRVLTTPEPIEDNSALGMLEPGEIVPEECRWRMSSRNGIAYLTKRGDEFVVLANSLMSNDTSFSFLDRYKDRREMLLQSGCFTRQRDGRYKLEKDIVFENVTIAAAVFSGRTPGGGIWKDLNGQSCNPA